jgi:hypothetical protein
MTLSILTLCHYAERHCAECHDLFIVILNVIMLSVVMLKVVMLSVVAPKSFKTMSIFIVVIIAVTY